MNQLIISAKVNEFSETILLKELVGLYGVLLSGNLHQFEEKLGVVFQDFYNVVAGACVEEAAVSSQPALRCQAQKHGIGKLTERALQVQLRTGHYVSVKSLYAKQIRKGYQGPRHLLSARWGLLKGSSPAYYSRACLMSMVSPSFEVASSVLSHLGIRHNRDRLQDLCGALSSRCKGQEAKVLCKVGETLAGKLVLIGIDGGRTRTREYKDKCNDAGHEQYDTPWMEPKLFVIEVLDKDGQIERRELPLYGCQFTDKNVIALLASYLRHLNIEQAECVEVVADGAPWIWNQMRPMLESLGVASDKIVEVLDYYHAAQYVHKIVAALPAAHKSNGSQILKELKAKLWNGQITELLKQTSGYFKKMTEDVKRYIGYLTKNQGRMDYQMLRDRKLVCGSGVIESGVRRVINLRFKNSSAFWKPDNVEGLFFLRGAFLSFRWDILINNLIMNK